VAGTLAGLVAAGVGIGFLYPVARRKARPLFICLESEVPKDRPLEFKDLQGRKVLLMYRKGSGELTAFGTVCTHLGCTVFWHPEKGLFECPCHAGVFDSDGVPISGPPQRPLKRYPILLRQGKIFVQFA